MITPGLFGTIKGSFIGVPRATVFRIGATIPEAGTYRILLRAAATVNDIAVSARTLGYDEQFELRAPPDAVTFYDQRQVFSSARQPLDIDEYAIQELEQLIPTDIVAINNRYHYFDLGTVEAAKGKHTFYFDKQDNNPMLVEGILVIPEAVYQTLGLPENVHLISESEDLCCARLGYDEGTP
jgi:hypothetical protein